MHLSVGSGQSISVFDNACLIESGHEIIDAIADKFPHKVNLDDPDWVILVETAGKQTGISVVRLANMLNIQKERVRLAAEAKKRAALDNKPA